MFRIGVVALVGTACQDTPIAPSPSLTVESPSVNASVNAASTSGYVANGLLLPRGYNAGHASDVNVANVVVGFANAPGGARHAVKWIGGQPTVLPQLRGYRESQAIAVNASGVIVGEAWNTGLPVYGSSEVPVMWTSNKVSVLPHQLTGAALDINDAGVVVGWGEDFAGKKRAVKWIGGLMLFVGPAGATQATAISSTGEIVGYPAWKMSGAQIVTLPLAPNDINASGLVVGAAGEAAVWSPASGLKLLGWGSLSYAAGVSAGGRVAGVGASPPKFQAITQLAGVVDTLPLLAGFEEAQASAVNACGSIAGNVFTNANPLTKPDFPVLWTKPTCDPRRN